MAAAVSTAVSLPSSNSTSFLLGPPSSLQTKSTLTSALYFNDLMGKPKRQRNVQSTCVLSSMNDTLEAGGKLATRTEIAPFRSFLWKMFFEKHEDYKFNGTGWLFLGVPTSCSLLYKEVFEKMQEKAPENFRLDFAVSREQINEKCEKMYILTRMAYYAEELWILLQKDNIVIYVCGLKGMEQGIDKIMSSPAERDGIVCADYKKQLKKADQWNVEVY